MSWDGPGLAYLESLFVPIFAALEGHGYAFDVLQFRWGSPEERDRAHAACRAFGIGYRSVTVRRGGGGLGPQATAIMGGRAIRRAMREFGSDILMPRSTMPAMATLYGRLAGLVPLLFDADGLEIDERAEFAGMDPGGVGYRLFRDAETQITRRATAVLVRTPAHRAILAARAGELVDVGKFFVVVNGRDANVFQPYSPERRVEQRIRLGLEPDAPLLIYVGGTGNKYDTPAITRFYEALASRENRTRLMVLTGDPEKAVAELGLASRPGSRDAMRILQVPPRDIPPYLAAADIGTAFSRLSFAIQGISPIKVGEYLLCGVPIVGTAVVGNQVEAVRSGVYFDIATGWERAVDWGLGVLADREGYRERARRCGVAGYSLERSVEDYLDALRYIAGRIRPATAPVVE